MAQDVKLLMKLEIAICKAFYTQHIALEMFLSMPQKYGKWLRHNRASSILIRL